MTHVLRAGTGADALELLYVFGAQTMLVSLATFMILLGASGCSAQDSYQQRRRVMVEDQLAARDIVAPRVLEAMSRVPRHRFVPLAAKPLAYADHPLPIGNGQTISQPYIVALMTQLAELDPSDVVLEIGTGSGYQAAVLADIVQTVYTIELVPELAESARHRLRAEGFDNVVVRQGDGYLGWEEHAPFDAILVTAAPERVPHALVEQLAPGAVLVVPVGPRAGVQSLRRIRKGRAPDETTDEEILPVRFVPMVREKK